MTGLASLVRTERPRLRGLYGITSADALGVEKLVQHVTQALEGGAALIQYRDKGTDTVRRLSEACALREICRSYQAPFIINDDVALARAVGADGVHLGDDDAAVSEARQQLGRDAIIGVSCYNTLIRARAAAAGGADYVAFGRFFPSHTKPQAVTASLGLLRAARAELQIPIVAIGGITPDNGAQLVAAGADMLAVVEGVFGADDVRGAAQYYTQLFEQQEK
ncbi:MAG: thiamine phosphate synthase [Gammaproteobacteria bacterium]|nr:thiamine phosphate synthase [Gammaproteobacteria bacterium]